MISLGGGLIQASPSIKDQHLLKSPTVTRKIKPGGAQDPKSLQALYTRPGFIIRRAHQIVAALFDEAATDLGITTTQYSVLYALRVRPGIDQISLCASIGVDRSTVASVVRLLEDGGLIARRADPNDRRRKQLTLTDAGHDMLRRAEPMTHVISDSMRTVLSDHQIMALKDILGSFVSAFNDKVRNPLVLDDRADLPTKPKTISKPNAAAKKRCVADKRVQ